MREAIFKVGDVVKMKGSIIPMTIFYVNQKENEDKITYQCQWFTKEGILNQSMFYEELLDSCSDIEIEEFWGK